LLLLVNTAICGSLTLCSDFFKSEQDWSVNVAFALDLYR